MRLFFALRFEYRVDYLGFWGLGKVCVLVRHGVVHEEGLRLDLLDLGEMGRRLRRRGLWVIWVGLSVSVEMYCVHWRPEVLDFAGVD